MYSPEQWRNQATQSLQSAQLLFAAERYRDCASRAYYAAYQASTAVCVAHGDSINFLPGWNNPSHEQLPGLIRANGSVDVQNRRNIIRLLRILRSYREDADYRPGRTVDQVIARECLSGATAVLKYLGVEA